MCTFWPVFENFNVLEFRFGKTSFSEYVAGNSTFRDMVIATASSYVLYILASFLHMDRNFFFNLSMAHFYFNDSICIDASNIHEHLHDLFFLQFA